MAPVVVPCAVSQSVQRPAIASVVVTIAHRRIMRQLKVVLTLSPVKVRLGGSGQTWGINDDRLGSVD
jgi:hypothetical protein